MAAVIAVGALLVFRQPQERNIGGADKGKQEEGATKPMSEESKGAQATGKEAAEGRPPEGGQTAAPYAEALRSIREDLQSGDPTRKIRGVTAVRGFAQAGEALQFVPELLACLKDRKPVEITSGVTQRDGAAAVTGERGGSVTFTSVAKEAVETLKAISNEDFGGNAAIWGYWWDRRSGAVDEQGMPPAKGKRTRVRLETGKGPVEVILYDDLAPGTVRNFLALANKGYYKDMIFHRIAKGFVIQTGDPTGTGKGGPGWAIPDEIVPELKHRQAGVVAMASAGPNTADSQFYITMGPTPHLDGHYSIFGQVVKGMDAVAAINGAATDQSERPVSPVAFTGVVVVGQEQAQ